MGRLSQSIIATDLPAILSEAKDLPFRHRLTQIFID